MNKQSTENKQSTDCTGAGQGKATAGDVAFGEGEAAPLRHGPEDMLSGFAIKLDAEREVAAYRVPEGGWQFRFTNGERIQRLRLSEQALYAMMHLAFGAPDEAA